MTLLNGVRYPAPRLDRGRPSAGADLAGDFLEDGPAEIAPPRVTLWPFAMLETAGGATLVVSPPLTGPAVVDFLDLTFNADNTAPRPSFGLRWSITPPTPGTNLALDARTLGTELFESASVEVEGGGSEFQDPRGLAKFTLDGPNARVHYVLKKLIREPRFFLNLAMGTQGVGTHRAAGYARILEAIDETELARFL